MYSHFSSKFLTDVGVCVPSVLSYSVCIVFCHYLCTKSKHVWIEGILNINWKNQKSKTTTRTMANNVKDQPEQTSKIVEFAGMATSKLINSRIKSRQRQDENKSTSHKENVYHLLLRRARNNDIYSLLIHETRKLKKNDQISLL